MSKEQLTEQQAQVGGGEAAAPAVDQTQGLPAHVYAQVIALGPADAPALADLLILYSGFTSRILAVAAPQVGNAAVQRAIAIAQRKQSTRGRPGSLNDGEMHDMVGEAPAPKAQGKPGTLSQAEMHEFLDDPAPAPKAQGKPGTLSQAEMHELLDDPAPAPKAQGKPGTLSQAEMHEFLDDSAPAPKAQGKPGTLSQAEMHEFLDDPAPAKAQGPKHPLSQAEMHEILDDPPAAKVRGKPGTLSQAEMHEFLDEPDQAPKAEPAWVAGARAYNLAHADLVADFNAATRMSCIGADGRLDPLAVAAWQSEHGVAADGRVGPHTLAAARAAAARGEADEAPAGSKRPTGQAPD